MKRLSNEEFMRKSKLRHGDKYDYSQVDYKSCRKVVTIGCPVHGVFEQIAWNHLAGWGCPDCGGTKKLTTDQFVRRSKIRHGNKYDYSLTDYVSDRCKVVILCEVHGKFHQRPADHLNGRGCPKCGGTGKSDTKEFIDKAKVVHGGKYDYSLVVYLNDVTKVTIICPVHGLFVQTPNSHLQGLGCDRCSGTFKLTTAEFVQKATEIHGNKYDYSHVSYETAHIKVEIVCRIHGPFMQKPNSHLFGHGCPKCRESRGEREIRKWLDQNDFAYKFQHRFPTCKRKHPLPFDFVIEQRDKTIAIEFQGEQHYRPVGFGGNAKNNYQKLKDADLIKKVWCEKNNVQLVEISYQQIDQMPFLLERLLA